jgi:hypothetical protein
VQLRPYGRRHVPDAPAQCPSSGACERAAVV